MTPLDRLRSMRTAALAQLIDPWPNEKPRAPSQRPDRGSAMDAPDWPYPDAPTEELTIPTDIPQGAP